MDLGPSHTAQQYTPAAALAETLALTTYYRRADVTITAG
jgi:hypothetical protein